MAKTYKIGHGGEGVRLIQRALCEAGYTVKTDGDYGPKTAEAVKAFQRQAGGLTADGIAGSKTLTRLFVGNITMAPINTHITRLAGRQIRYISIHYTAGGNSRRGAAMQNRNVFLKRSASADFVVDDEQTVQVNPNPEGYYCWAVGDKKNPYSGGGQLYGRATNRNTVSIEMCSTLAKGTSAAAPNHEGWTLSDAVVARTLRLVRYLMMAYDIPRERVIRHYDVTGKLCPGVPGWNNGPLYNTDGKQTNRPNGSSEWTKFLAAMNVRQMNFNYGNGNGGNSVAQSNAVVSECARVQQDEVVTPASFLNCLDEFAFVIRLQKIYRIYARFFSAHFQRFVYIVQRQSPVNFRLSRPQQIQIRSVQN